MNKDREYICETVFLDHETFDRCRFKDSRLEYHGVGMVRTNACSFDGCTFAFDGPAQSTLAFISALYQMDGGASVVEGLFEQLRRGEIDGMPAELN